MVKTVTSGINTKEFSPENEDPKLRKNLEKKLKRRNIKAQPFLHVLVKGNYSPDYWIHLKVPCKKENLLKFWQGMSHLKFHATNVGSHLLWRFALYANGMGLAGCAKHVLKNMNVLKI